MTCITPHVLSILLICAESLFLFSSTSYLVKLRHFKMKLLKCLLFFDLFLLLQIAPYDQLQMMERLVEVPQLTPA